MMTSRLPVTPPSWATHLIVAIEEHDVSDSMTDYFNTRDGRTVALAWSRHGKDLFSEMRKAAALFPETAHLGPGKDVWTANVVFANDVGAVNGTSYWKGGLSHWHRDLYPDTAGWMHGPKFTTREEAEAFIAKAGPPHDISFDGTVGTFEWRIERSSIEHREKYSMGAGYYLKASGRYSTGWKVEKIALPGEGRYSSGTDHIDFSLLTAPKVVRFTAPPSPAATEVLKAEGFASLALNAEKNGVEIKFAAKPDAATLDALKGHGWRWSRWGGLWYHRDTPGAREFAEKLVGGLNG